MYTIKSTSRAVRTHITPEEADFYFLAALRESTALSSKLLISGHKAVMGKVVDKLGDHLNLASAIVSVLTDTTFARAAASEGEAGLKATSPAGGTVVTGDLAGRIKELEQQLSNKDNTIEQLRRPKGAGGGSGLGKRDAEGGAKVKKNVCYPFQEGKCLKGEQCPNLHRCLRCGEEGHGAGDCKKELQ